jgi:hypothetical protein
MTVHGRLLLIERVRVAGWRVVDAAAVLPHRKHDLLRATSDSSLAPPLRVRRRGRAIFAQR